MLKIGYLWIVVQMVSETTADLDQFLLGIDKFRLGEFISSYYFNNSF